MKRNEKPRNKKKEQMFSTTDPDFLAILSHLSKPLCIKKSIGKGAHANAYALSREACSKGSSSGLGSDAKNVNKYTTEEVLVVRPCDDHSFADFLKGYQLQQRASQLHISPQVYSITREGKVCSSLQERLDTELQEKKYTLVPARVQSQMLHVLQKASQHGLWHKDVANLKNWMMNNKQNLFLIDWDLGDIVDPDVSLPQDMRPPLSAFTQDKKTIQALSPIAKQLSKGKASHEILFYMLLQILSSPNRVHFSSGPLLEGYKQMQEAFLWQRVVPFFSIVFLFE
jgi:hypothetical protein